MRGRATPRPVTIRHTAECANCGETIRAELGDWYHAYSKSVHCPA